jgi:hypothetical protein
VNQWEAKGGNERIMNMIKALHTHV